MLCARWPGPTARSSPINRSAAPPKIWPARSTASKSCLTQTGFTLPQAPCRQSAGAPVCSCSRRQATPGNSADSIRFAPLSTVAWQAKLNTEAIGPSSPSTSSTRSTGSIGPAGSRRFWLIVSITVCASLSFAGRMLLDASSSAPMMCCTSVAARASFNRENIPPRSRFPGVSPPAAAPRS